MNKILKKILLTTLILVTLCITKQNIVNGVGFVYQAWADDGGSLYFRTFTAPHPSVLSAYRGYTKTEPTLTTSISPTGWFYNYKDTSTAGRTSKWAIALANKTNKDAFTNDKPTVGAFSTRKLIFHTIQTSTYGGSGKYKYTIVNQNNALTSSLNSIPNIYGDASASSKTGFSTNSNYASSIITSIDESYGQTSLYRMTLLAVSIGDSNPVYVADRVLNSGTVNRLKTNILPTGIRYKNKTYNNSVFVSQALGYADTQAGENSGNWANSGVTIAENPEMFDRYGGWQGGTLGTSDSDKKALGSALNLYDNILMFPTEVSRYITVKHINIGTDQTVTQSNRSNVVKTDPDNEDIKTQQSYSKEGHGTYLGYNMVTGDTSSKAESNMKSQAGNGIANKGDTCTVNAYSGTKDQYVIVEMYYNNEPPPPEQGDTMTVISRHVIYNEDNSEIVKVVTGDEKQITTGNTTVGYKSDIGNVDGNTVTYTGYYEVVDDDATIPESMSGTTSGQQCTVSFAAGKDIVYVNFKYKVKIVQTRTIYIRDICYSSTGIVMYTSLRSETINTNETKTVSYKGNEFSPTGNPNDKYNYVGYIALYDKAMPSCYAYVDKSSYTVNGAKVKTGACINFMYQKNGITEIPLGSPKQTDEGHLNIADSGDPDKIYGNGINNDFSVIQSTPILSVPCGENIRIGMKDLRKYYIAGIRMEEKIEESKEGGILEKFKNWLNLNDDLDLLLDNNNSYHMTFKTLHVMLVVVVDVNHPLDFTRTKITPYYDRYNFVIPYKYIKYELKNAAIYELKQSEIYTPDGNNSNQTYGNKILDSAVFQVINKKYGGSGYDVDYNKDNVEFVVARSGSDLVKVLDIKAEATFTITSGLLDKMPTNIINSINEETLEETNYEDISSSRIIAGPTSIISTSLLGFFANNALSDDGDSGIISNITSILGNGSTDAVILEIIPAYTNVSTERKTFWEAVGTITKCGLGTVSSLLGIDFLNWVQSCEDVPQAIQGLINWYKSLRKTAVYVYKAYGLDGKEKFYVGNIGETLLPGTVIRKEIDDKRIIEKTFTLGTSSRNSILKLKGTGIDEDIAKTRTIFRSALTLLDDLARTWGTTILELFGADSLISQRRVSDLNFTLKSGGGNIITSTLNIPRKFNYLFDGWVCVYDGYSGMSITDSGKDVYINGFGNKIQAFSDSPQNYIKDTIKLSTVGADDSDKRVNGVRSFSEVTTYIGAKMTGSEDTFIDNIFWSNLNIIGFKNVFTYNKSEISMNHNVYNKKADAVNVYTPVKLYVSDPETDDDKLISQISDAMPPTILNNNQFYFYISPEDYNGVYGPLNKDKINKYIEKYILILSFDAEKITYGNTSNFRSENDVKAGNKLEILNDSIYYESGTKKIKVTIKADGELNGAQAYVVRAIAKNMTSSLFTEGYKLTYEDFFDIRSNICNTIKDITANDGPVYYDEKITTIESEVVDRLYDFRVTDVKDIDWKDIFRTTNSSSHSKIAYYTGLRKYNLVSGMLKRTKAEVGNILNRTLPIGPYKSTDSTYVKAPKMGYRISFDIKLSGEYSEEADPIGGGLIRDINITPKFYYIKKDGTGYNNTIDLYYKNDSGKYITIDNYALNYTPKDGIRLLSEPDEDNKLSDKVQLLGSPIKLTLKPATMTTGYIDGDYQTYYGEYKLPNSTIAVPSGAVLNETNKLKDGYIGVIFEIKSKFKYSGTIYNLNYSQNMDRDTDIVYNPHTPEACNSSQWEYEGYLKQQYNKKFASAKLQLEKGIWQIDRATYDQIKGTVVLFDLDARASSDFD